jgi:3-oxoacyl-[acyl-carrier protein] reductase
MDHTFNKQGTDTMTDTTTPAKVALVFGGSRGIGAGIARRLAADGFKVGLTYVSGAGAARNVVADIASQGGEAFAIQADSATPDAPKLAVAQVIERFGGLDVAVVNAGILRLATLDHFSLDDLDASLNVNIRGVVLAVQAAAAHMTEGGRIIMIGSNTAERPVAPGGSIYAMTKAAIAAFAKGAALDFAARGITVNTIQPGPIGTDMTSGMADYILPRIPLGRMGTPADVAALVSYVASPASAYMTGASLTIDGGFIL